MQLQGVGRVLKIASSGFRMAPKGSLFSADMEAETRETRAHNPNWKAYLIAVRGSGLNLKMQGVFCRVQRCSGAPPSIRGGALLH